MIKKQLITILLTGFYFSLFAQSKITGLWEGKLTVGTPLRIVFHIDQKKDTLAVTMDSPDQGVKNIRSNAARFSSDTLYIEIAQIRGSYKGWFINDSTINGLWSQGIILPLKIKKVESISEAKRPQTPVPPFPYISEDVLYTNKDKSISYGATITIPYGKGPFPAVLLITGSGQQNRNEEIFGHKPFAVIADYLTRKGMIVLRVDDRGVGQSTGEVKSATSEDFARDVGVSLDYLIDRKETNRKKVGLIGHSEGGMIAQMVAAQRNDIDFVIFLAGPGEKCIDLMTDQYKAVAATHGLSREYINQYSKIYKQLLTIVAQSPDNESAKQKAEIILNEWLDTASKNIVLFTTGIKDQPSKEEFLNALMNQAGTPWFRYFLNYQPDLYIKKIKAHVLALNGDKDIQVVSGNNLASMESSLKKSSARSYELKELKGLNHLFQHCTYCTLQEYAMLEETFAPEALNIIWQWLEKILRVQ